MKEEVGFMKKYEYIIFDMDDTLIDNLENVRYAYTKMMEYKGLEYSDDGFQRWYDLDKQFWLDFSAGLIVVPDEYKFDHDMFVKYVQSLRYVKYFNNEINIEEAFKINDLFLNSLKEVVIEVEGASKVLSELSKKYKLVIATNGPRQAVYTKIEKIGCSDFISYVFSADMTNNTVTKPSEFYFDEMMEYLNFKDKDKMLIVGDSLKTDVKGGMNSLIDSCWYNPNKEILGDDYKPTYVIEKLEDILNIL